MNFILIRHALSFNNELLNNDPSNYNLKRQADPSICSDAPSKCQKLGKFLKDNNYRIDKFFCSLHKRAIETLSNIAETYDKNVPQEYFPGINELSAIHENGKNLPGLTLEDVKKDYPHLTIPESIDIAKGWNYNGGSAQMLPRSEGYERAKEVVRKFKEMAAANAVEGYTVCLVSHQLFLNLVILLLNDGKVEDNFTHLNYAVDNISLTRFCIDKSKKVRFDYVNYCPEF